MPTIDEEVRIRTEVQRRLDTLVSQLPERLERPDLEAGIRFADYRSAFDSIHTTAARLQDAGIEQLPYYALTQVQSMIDQANHLWQEILGFSVAANPSNWQNVREQLVQRTNSLESTFFTSLAPHLSYALAVKAGRGADAARAAVAEAVSQLTAEAQRRVDELQGFASQGEVLLAKLRDTAQSTGVDRHGSRFEEEAKGHDDASTRWLIATSILAALTAAAALVNLFVLAPRELSGGTPVAIQVAMAKLIVFSVLISAVVWSGKVYRAHRHNATLNRHRTNALSTFETFALSASDLETKNAVLLQATQSIFAPQSTGYVGNDSEPSGFPQIVELYRSLGSAGGKATP